MKRLQLYKELRRHRKIADKRALDSTMNKNAKIMVFDKACNAIAKPILKIDENDIAANHAAVVGKVNDEHLFYLTHLLSLH